MRGELLAIHAALHSQSFPMDQSMHLMTESLISLYLIAAYLVRPSHVRYHKHIWLVAAITQNVVARQGPVLLTKVRAHIGVHGNTLADCLASQAHDNMNAVLTGYCDPCDRGPAWPQCISHGQLQDLNDLKQHALTVSAVAYAESVQGQWQHLKSPFFLRVHAAIAHHGGWHEASTSAFGESSRVAYHMRSLAIHVRYGTLFTGAKLAKWYPSDGLTSACLLCLAPGDTIGHQLGACTFPAVKNQICARHNDAVHVIALESGMAFMAIAGC